MLLIDKWFSGTKNFITGRNLYDQYGSNKALKSLLLKGETDHSRRLLEEALQEINTSGNRPTLPTPAVISIEVMPKGTDAVLMAIEAEWKEKYSRMNLLRHQLDGFGKYNTVLVREKCKEICKDILEIEEQVMQLWAKRDHYKEHGSLPEIVVDDFIVPDNAVDLAKAINTLERNIRRNKEKATKNPANSLYPALVLKYENQLKKIHDSKN